MPDSRQEEEFLLIRKKKSRLRQEIEELLQKRGLVWEERVAVINLESKECHYFPDYPEAMQFLRGKNGRWYIATPGLRRLEGGGLERDDMHR
ncbi:MAG: hypothetical protein WAZ20_09775 [Methanothrix sp.]|jgi:hypothetical protein|uniref:hypothetical protein n=1 Tax=Methanothrix sp. TaxID=90426 RepID=UPI002CE7F42B|nr:hypothetical protein [Methanothrix sp.]